MELVAVKSFCRRLGTDYPEGDMHPQEQKSQYPVDAIPDILSWYKPSAC